MADFSSIELVVDGQLFSSMDTYFPGLKPLPENHKEITEVQELLRCTAITDAVFPLIWDTLDDLKMDIEDVSSAARLIRLHDPWEYDPDLRFFIFHERNCIVHAVQRDSRMAFIIHKGSDLTRAKELDHLKSAVTRLDRGQKIIESPFLHRDIVDFYLVRRLIRSHKSSPTAKLPECLKSHKSTQKPMEVKESLADLSIEPPVLVVTSESSVIQTKQVADYFLKSRVKTHGKRNGDDLRKILQDQPKQLEQLNALLVAIKEAVELARHPTFDTYTMEIYSLFVGNGRAMALHHKYMEIHEKANELFASTTPDQKPFIDRILKNAANNIGDSPFTDPQDVVNTKRTQSMLSDRGVVLLMYPARNVTKFAAYRVDTCQCAIFFDTHDGNVRTRMQQLDNLSIAWLKLKRGKKISKVPTLHPGSTPKEIAETIASKNY